METQKTTKQKTIELTDKINELIFSDEYDDDSAQYSALCNAVSEFCAAVGEDKKDAKSISKRMHRKVKKLLNDYEDAGVFDI